MTLVNNKVELRALSEKMLSTRQIGGGTLQIAQQINVATEIGWAGVFSKASAKRIQSQQGNKKIHPDLAEAINIIEEMSKATDKKQHPWKRFHGSVHPVQPGVSWFILSQEGLVAAGALGASIDGWHIGDLSKIIASVLDAKFLETAQGNAHIWVYGTDHPDGSSFIPFGFYVTLDPNQ